MYFSEIADCGKKCETGNPSNLGLILEDITALIEVLIISINH
jgi:hypothetical protein